MDPRAYLTELGYTAEDISAMLADEKQAKLITHAAKSYSEGRTLKTQAEAEKAETATFWEQKTRELQGSVNRLTAAEKRASDVTGRAAKVATRQIELANMGYEDQKMCFPMLVRFWEWSRVKISQIPQVHDASGN